MRIAALLAALTLRARESGPRMRRELAEEYARLDARCEALTLHERRLTP